MTFFFLLLIGRSADAREIPKDLPASTLKEIQLVERGVPPTSETDRIQMALCPEGISRKSQSWLLEQLQAGFALASAKNSVTSYDDWEKIQKACPGILDQNPNLRACIQPSLDYQKAFKMATTETNNDPQKALVPQFILTNPDLQKKLLHLKDIEGARELLTKVAPDCSAYKAKGTIPAGTYPESLGRLLIHCPTKNGRIAINVAYTTDEAAEKRLGPIGNISVVEEIKQPDGSTDAYYADYNRVDSEDKTTYERNQRKQNCAACHASGIYAVHKQQVAPQHIEAWRKAFKDSREFVHTPNTSGTRIPSEHLGPLLGTVMTPKQEAKERSDAFFDRCTDNFPNNEQIWGPKGGARRKTLYKDLRKTMDCSRCHSPGGSFEWGYAPPLRGPVAQSIGLASAIVDGLMPPDSKLEGWDRWALVTCLQQEYFGAAKYYDIEPGHEGQLTRSLTEIDCATGQKKSPAVVQSKSESATTK